MNNTTKSLILGCSLAALTSASAEIETEVHAGYHSIYEFRGVNLGENLYTAGVDLGTEIAEGLTLSGGVWYGNTDGVDSNAGADFDEVDLYIGLTQSIGSFDVSVGYTHYNFPGNNDVASLETGSTDEVYVGVATELSCGLGLAATYFHDTNEFDAGYLEVEASKSYELSPCVGLDLAVGAAYSFGYNNDVNGGSLDGFNHYFVSASLPWAAGNNFTITPYVKYVGADSDFSNDASESDNNADLFFGGVTLSYAF